MGKSILNVDENMKLDDRKKEVLAWLSPLTEPFGLAGFPWIARDGLYRRLPAEPAYPIREAVDFLADCPAGGQIRFRTDSPNLSIRVKLAAPADMYHMPATGQCGFDCYLGEPGQLKYVSTTRFDMKAAEFESVFYEGLPRSMRNVTVNFPLYRKVEEVWIGVDHEASVEAPPAFGGGSIVFYGTSITQGGCAARPGMAYPNVLSRRLDRECVNLGFSGNGKGEPELARLIGEIPDPALIVLDYIPNVSTEEFRETLPVFLEILREAHPAAPVLVVSSIRYAGDTLNPVLRKKRIDCRDFAKRTVEARQATGDAAIAFLNGDHLLGRGYDECTVDGVHPTDLGFMRMAESMLKPIKRMLGEG